jgi:phosphoribosylformylglycinamidine (FGAM) synthase-like amidotransferase family enzyme
MIGLLWGLGLHTHTEVAFALNYLNIPFEMIFIEDYELLKNKMSSQNKLKAFIFPGGFTYGDEEGAGILWAKKYKHHLGNRIIDYVHEDGKILGICNGFQMLSHLGLLPVTLEKNKKPFDHFWCGRVGGEVIIQDDSRSPWTRHFHSQEAIGFSLRHGAGCIRLHDSLRDEFKQNKHNKHNKQNKQNTIKAFFRYTDLNPNGSEENLCGLTDSTGNILGLMAHPEGSLWPWQKDQWGLKLFQSLSENKMELQ